MHARSSLRTVLAVAAATLFGLAASVVDAEAADLIGSARVRDDATLSIHGRAIRLVGIYVPPTNYFCQTFQSPVQCGSRAALALDFHIGDRFVSCNVLGRYADGSVAATCWITSRRRRERDDLAAWLIAHGWALASPEAPFEYSALERIARVQGRGIWGFSVDRID